MFAIMKDRKYLCYLTYKKAYAFRFKKDIVFFTNIYTQKARNMEIEYLAKKYEGNIVKI